MALNAVAHLPCLAGLGRGGGGVQQIAKLTRAMQPQREIVRRRREGVAMRDACRQRVRRRGGNGKQQFRARAILKCETSENTIPLSVFTIMYSILPICEPSFQSLCKYCGADKTCGFQVWKRADGAAQAGKHIESRHMAHVQIILTAHVICHSPGVQLGSKWNRSSQQCKCNTQERHSRLQDRTCTAAEVWNKFKPSCTPEL